MTKTRRWIERELLSDSGVRFAFEHEIQLHASSISLQAYNDHCLADELANCNTKWGSLAEIISKLLAGGRGLWFYAGWVDQAVLQVGKVQTADGRYLPTMLQQFDKDQIEQGGDMLIGLAALQDDWIFFLEVSPQNSKFTACLRSNHEKDIKNLLAALEP